MAYRSGANSYLNKLITASMSRILLLLSYVIIIPYHCLCFHIISAFRYPFLYQNEE